jgi:hypothetical protein
VNDQNQLMMVGLPSISCIRGDAAPWDNEEILCRLEACAGDGYEFDSVVVAAKVLMRMG